jgi:hypothetical protein
MVQAPMWTLNLSSIVSNTKLRIHWQPSCSFILFYFILFYFILFYFSIHWRPCHPPPIFWSIYGCHFYLFLWVILLTFDQAQSHLVFCLLGHCCSLDFRVQRGQRPYCSPPYLVSLLARVQLVYYVYSRLNSQEIEIEQNLVEWTILDDKCDYRMTICNTVNERGIEKVSPQKGKN